MTEERLLLNAVELGEAIKPFYGETAGNRLAKLLETLNRTLIALVKEVKNNGSIDSLVEQAGANIIDLADFLDNANPNQWPKSAVLETFTRYLELTKSEIEAKRKKDWEADIYASDKIKNLMMTFADTFAKGLIEQFPQKFFL